MQLRDIFSKISFETSCATFVKYPMKFFCKSTNEALKTIFPAKLSVKIPVYHTDTFSCDFCLEFLFF